MITRKTIPAGLVLTIFVGLGLFSLISNYQWQPKTMAAENLRNEFINAASNSASSFAIAITTQKIDNFSSNLRIESTGKFVDSLIEIQPIFVSKDSVEKEPVLAGEKTTVKQSKQTAGSFADQWADIKAIFPSNEKANAVTLKISSLTAPAESITVIVPLTNTASFSGVKLPTATNASTCNCVEVSGSSASCEIICGYCANSIGNTVDLMRCRIICGTRCPNPQGCPRCE